MSGTNIDPTTVATVWHSMQTICREMRHIVKQTAQNYLIGQYPATTGREDVENGLVSIQAARDVYKVVVDPATFQLDRETTKSLRSGNNG